MAPCNHPPLPELLEPLHAVILAMVPWWRPIFGALMAAMLAYIAAVVCLDFPASWRAERERRRVEELRRLRAAAIDRAVADYHERRKSRPRRSTRGRER